MLTSLWLAKVSWRLPPACDGKRIVSAVDNWKSIKLNLSSWTQKLIGQPLTAKAQAENPSYESSSRIRKPGLRKPKQKTRDVRKPKQKTRDESSSRIRKPGLVPWWPRSRRYPRHRGVRVEALLQRYLSGGCPGDEIWIGFGCLTLFRGERIQTCEQERRDPTALGFGTGSIRLRPVRFCIQFVLMHILHNF